ncbi:MAG: aspartyl/glutamyl-tRNA amidotransferase subunit C [archaeon]|nr:aspartyl/glutamyl-tRNA amidotransferase subunit C [archaeon]
MAKIETEAQQILDELSKALENIPELEENENEDVNKDFYIVDNLNLSRKDESEKEDSSKIVRNARTDKNGNIVVKKADWIN